MNPDEICVAWCAPEAVRSRLEGALPGFRVTWTTPSNPFVGADVAVLDTRSFAGLRDLLRTKATQALCPVLILCSTDEAERLASEVYESDDLALHESPPSLMALRVRRLVEGRAGRDSLTGLAQRFDFLTSFQQAAENPARLPLSLLLLDLDDFKKVNDTHGHAAGDSTLKEAAVQIVLAAPPDTVVGRFGGDEFAVFGTLPAGEALGLAEQIRKAFKAATFSGGDQTVSIGCATATVVGRGLFSRADEALYAAKARGGDSVIHYDDMARRAREADGDVGLDGFENRTRVLAERMAALITGRGRRLFERLKEQADLDALTRMFNRGYLDRRLHFEIESSSEKQTAITIALLDIDHFGQVNKNHGWPSGDKVLTDVAGRIRWSLRDDDWVARYGGEEICVVMYGTTREAALPVLERVRCAVADTPFETTEGRRISITVSAGGAEHQENESLEELMERVSHNLLLAKQRGRNCVVI
jgi:diguanylate cyclase (GGDEF)-like protein